MYNKSVFVVPGIVKVWQVLSASANNTYLNLDYSGYTKIWSNNCTKIRSQQLGFDDQWNLITLPEKKKTYVYLVISNLSFVYNNPSCY